MMSDGNTVRAVYAGKGNLTRRRESIFRVGDVVLTPMGREATVVNADDHGRCDLEYAAHPHGVVLDRGHLLLLRRAGD